MAFLMAMPHLPINIIVDFVKVALKVTNEQWCVEVIKLDICNSIVHTVNFYMEFPWNEIEAHHVQLYWKQMEYV